MTKKIAFLLAIIISLAASAAAWAQTEEAPPPEPTEIQKTIALLEDETKRAEVVRLLKLMDVMEAESAAPAAASPAPPPENASGPESGSVKEYLSANLDHIVSMLRLSYAGFTQSADDAGRVAGALTEEAAFEIWYRYVVRVSLWSLACLGLFWGLLAKFGAEPNFVPEARGRILALLRYLLWPIVPAALLVLAIGAHPFTLHPHAAPEPITNARVLGFEFIQDLLQNFFMAFGFLCIARRLFTALLKPDKNGRSLVNINPIKSRQILHTLNVVAIYLALFVVIKTVFLEHFTYGALYSLCIILMTLPLPIYLTFRILRIRSFFHENEAAPKEEGATEPEKSLEYQADIFIRRHWAPILIALVWILEILAIANPSDAVERFAGRILGTALIILLAWLTITIERRLALKLVGKNDENHEQGRHLLLSTDLVANIVVWLGALGLLVSLWGLPLESILKSPMTLEIVGRAFAIVITVVALALFLKFSNLATSWLMSSKDFGESRNLRTMLPLIHTVVRALAVFVGLVVILDRLGVNIGPILAGAGILSLGVGMGAQTLVKDVINGIFILLMNTVSVGDYVTMGGRSGTVDFLGLRTARLRDINGNLIIIPNSNITDIVNMTRDFSQEVVELSVPYDVDVDAMLEMARETAAELSEDPEWAPLMTAPVEVFGVTAFDSKTSTIRLRVNAKAGSQWPVGRELRLRLRRRTQAYALETPWFTQNVIVHQG